MKISNEIKDHLEKKFITTIGPDVTLSEDSKKYVHHVLVNHDRLVDALKEITYTDEGVIDLDDYHRNHHELVAAINEAHALLKELEGE